MIEKNPENRFGLVTFNNNVQIYGDGSKPMHTLKASLDNANQI